MRFGIFSNGFRPHTAAEQAYQADLEEIVLADELGFEIAYISEHHGEPLYIDKVDTLPVPELLMCKAAGMTKQIKMGSAVKVIHLHHPLDTAIQAAVTDHVIGQGRFVFGFGSGFSSPLFCQERGLGFEDRHERLMESLDFILRCWGTPAPFDWDGKYWRGKNICATPQPLAGSRIPMATATDNEQMLHLAGARGYTLLTAHDPPHLLKQKTARYLAGAQITGRQRTALGQIAHARFIYVSNSRRQALDEIRNAATFELSFQIRRGLFRFVSRLYGWDLPEDQVTVDELAERDWFIVGNPDDVAERLAGIFHESGGFGTLLMVTGKNWADRSGRLRSMRLFAEQVAPVLCPLEVG